MGGIKKHPKIVTILILTGVEAHIYISEHPPFKGLIWSKSTPTSIISSMQQSCILKCHLYFGTLCIRGQVQQIKTTHTTVGNEQSSPVQNVTMQIKVLA